jgi:hypothetical protein
MSPYGCWNKPRPVAGKPILVQDAYYSMPPVPDGQTCLSLRYVTVPFAMSTDCQYTQQHRTDPHCAGCTHQTSTAVPT